MRVVVADQRKIQLSCELDEQRVDAVLFFDVALKLDVKTRCPVFVGLESFCVPFRLGERGLPVGFVLGFVEQIGRASCRERV